MILFETSEFYDKAVDIISIVFACIFLTLIMTYLIIIGIEELKTKEIRKDFKSKLENEHDKALIHDYENAKYTFFKKGKKKQ